MIEDERDEMLEQVLTHAQQWPIQLCHKSSAGLYDPRQLLTAADIQAQDRTPSPTETTEFV